MMILKFELPKQSKCDHCGSKGNLFASPAVTEKSQMICKECFTTSIFFNEDSGD